MADILFTHSYFLRFDPKEYRAMIPYPPLGTLYAVSVVRKAGYSVALFDSMLASSEHEILQHIRQHRPRVVVIYDDDFNYLTKMCLTRMREAAFTMATLAKQEGCTVIVHGSDPVDHLEKYFTNHADYVICGEGEDTLCEILDHVLNSGKQPGEIAGLAYRDGDRIKRGAERPVLKNLDSLPFPAWDLVDIERYRALWQAHHGYFSINMVTTRGCPFHCNWCAKPIYGQVYNSRSPHNVVEEMQLIRHTIKPDHLWFCDDIFGLKPGWVEAFSNEVVRRAAVIPFKCLGRVDLLLKDNTIEHLRRAGCRTVWVGAESGSQRILDAMEKGTTVAQIYEATRSLKQAGIRAGFFLQFGYPGETRADIELTLKMVRDCAPDEIGVSVSYPLPGTRFYDRVRSELGTKQNWVDSQDLDMMFAGTYHPDFYRVLHKVVHKKFSVWRGMQTMKNALRNPYHIPRKSIRHVASMLYHGATLPIELGRLAMFENRTRGVPG